MSMEKFHYTTASGVEIVMPHLKALKSGMVRRNRHKEQMDFMYSILEELLEDDVLDILDDLDLSETQRLFAEWQKDGGVSTGESSGSST